MPEAIKVAFITCTDDLIPSYIASIKSIHPELKTVVCSEFPIEGYEWIPYHPKRHAKHNAALIKSKLQGRKVQHPCILLQPQTPYWPMRAIACTLNPLGAIIFNENLDHWMLRPRCIPTILRHVAWRASNFLRAKPKPIDPPKLPKTEPLATCPGAKNTQHPKLLIVAPYLPYPLTHGGAVRMFNLMKRAAEDFDIILLAFATEIEEPSAELKSITSEITVVRREGTHLRTSSPLPHVVEEFQYATFREALRAAIRTWKPEIVQLEYTQMAQYAKDCAPARTILVEHDITTDFYRQLLKDNDDWETKFQLERWEKFEKQAWTKVDAVVTMSKEDQEIVATQNTFVIPNGVDPTYFQPQSTKPDERRLLFVAPFSHLPNQLATKYFLEEIWPLLEEEKPILHLMAGKNPPRFNHPRIEVDDFIPDIREAYARATIVIAPLQASAGTKIKILEAMSMGKPIVTTPQGARGLNLRAQSGVFLAATPKEYAERIIHLIRNPQERDQAGRLARQAVEKRFSWDSIAQTQTEMYKKLRRSRPQKLIAES